jgi:predicted NACHT family NTPase
VKELIIKEAIKGISKLLFTMSPQEGTAKLCVKYNDIEKALSHHLLFIENWSSQIAHKDMPKYRNLDDVFIPMSFSHQFDNRSGNSFGENKIFNDKDHKIILGYPGSGKTTTIKRLCQYLLHESPRYSEFYNHPILVRFRDLKNDFSLIDYIVDIFGIKIDFADENKLIENRRLYRSKIKERVVVEYLNQIPVLVCLDGLDELYTGNLNLIISEIKKLTNLLTKSKIVLTCRVGALDTFFDNSETLYICPFSGEDINEFIYKWFPVKEEAKNFLEEVSKSPYNDTIGRPLTLVNLCMIFDAYGELPSPPSVIYQKIILLLLEEWDRQRDLKRTSNYGKFGPERKKQFLSQLAYELSFCGSGSTFETGDLKRIYRKIHTQFDLAFDQRDIVLSEIESHTGLFIRIGFSKYEFSHKSLQEFLCADYISRLPDLMADIDVLILLPNECAIATILSSIPNKLFEFFLQNFLVKKENKGELLNSFWGPYLSRLHIESVSFKEDISIGLQFILLFSFEWVHYKENSYCQIEITPTNPHY